VYGLIDEDMALDFAVQIKKLETTARVINVRINSKGGSVYDGMAMFTCMRKAKCAIDVYIDGIAASMASALAFAGRKLYMSKYARLMTHKPSGGSFGNADELRAVADEIDQCEADITGMMSERLGIDSEEVKTKYLNGKNNYFRADAALALGLVDGVYDGEEVTFPDDAPVDEVYDMFQTRFEAHLNNEETFNPINMRQIPLAVWGQICAAMEITDSADDTAVVASVKTLTAKAKRAETAERKLKEKEQEVAAEMKERTGKEITAMLDNALRAKKITAKQKDIFARQYEEDVDGLKEMLDSMGAFISVNDRLNQSERQAPGVSFTPDVQAMVDKGWDALDKSGKLADLRAKSEDGYLAVYEEKHGCKPGERVHQQPQGRKGR